MAGTNLDGGDDVRDRGPDLLLRVRLRALGQRRAHAEAELDLRQNERACARLRARKGYLRARGRILDFFIVRSRVIRLQYECQGVPPRLKGSGLNQPISGPEHHHFHRSR